VGASCAPGRRGRGGNRLQTITFSQHGRAFFAIVAFGPDVTAATERAAWATLNSITASALPVTDPAIATEITAAYQNAVMIDNADANSSAIAGGALVDINLVRAAVERLGYGPDPYRITVTNITLTDPRHARLVYTLYINGGEFERGIGTAVQDGDGWKVSRQTACRWIATLAIPCPPA
jgi:hypothetical protein